MDEAACLALRGMRSHTAAPIVQNETLKWNCIGLITFEGSLGANLAYLSRDKPFWFKILFLPDYMVLTS